MLKAKGNYAIFAKIDSSKFSSLLMADSINSFVNCLFVFIAIKANASVSICRIAKILCRVFSNVISFASASTLFELAEGLHIKPIELLNY